jgi:response regulator RpfG family c-di-GMP phosphodiesterase
LTAIFHDLGLVTLPERFRQEDEHKMSTHDFAQYRLHPQQSVEILKLMGITDSAVLQAVAQHHEKRDKSGFPNQSGAGEIHPYAEAVGISDDLVREMRNNSEMPLRELLQRFRDASMDRYSIATIEAIDILRLWTICRQ